MGCYYDIELAFNLREDVPAEVVSKIAFLMGEATDAAAPPAHPSFDEHTWRSGALAQHVTSPPKRGAAVCSFQRVLRYTQMGRDHYQYTFHLRCSSKLEPIFEDLLVFLQWAAQYCDGRQFVGYFVEEYESQPTLLYVSEGKAYMKDVREPPCCVDDGSPWVQAKPPQQKRWWRFWS